MTDLQLNFVKIPASEFIIGSKRSLDKYAHDDEMPTQVLSVSDYFIMKYPVTNAQYYQFVQATGCRTPLFWSNGAYPPTKQTIR
jgi:iron(II)-dependent oxidoreductase